MNKRVRFQILSRDKFTCQYCGGKPPDVILEVDHIKSALLGDYGDTTNYITACRDCNIGKSNLVVSINPPEPVTTTDKFTQTKQINILWFKLCDKQLGKRVYIDHNLYWVRDNIKKSVARDYMITALLQPTPIKDKQYWETFVSLCRHSVSQRGE